ncbi:hypothetical protein L1987_30679 [Smallanthus sonchifolius]|uniref:Uncharacterized protein n=1 Tax=Smallanthus sonchifolius TaxID=185202 RepID=A0ACB9I3E1_9ASTR|nr:hypothetical protein L1987_30679 [Smallanthus sonchifolius]
MLYIGAAFVPVSQCHINPSRACRFHSVHPFSHVKDNDAFQRGTSHVTWPQLLLQRGFEERPKWFNTLVCCCLARFLLGFMLVV